MMEPVLITDLEFITPGFVCGSNQNRPEVRPSSIRGELRWWFRVLGGTREEESHLFGSVHGSIQSSAVVIRVTNENIQKSQAIALSPNTPKYYIYYFASVSGNDEGVHRTAAGNFIAAGSSFTLQILLRREIPEALRQRFNKAIEAFLNLGALGLRATRGCGSFATRKLKTRAELSAWVKTLPPQIVVRTAGEPNGGAIACQVSLGEALRDLRRKTGCSGKDKSAFGFSGSRERQASALRLRPVKIAEGVLPLLIYTDAACSEASQAQAVVGYPLV